MSPRWLAELDLREITLRRDQMLPSEIFDVLHPVLTAAEFIGVTIEIEIAPLLPAILGDRARLQDALATLLGDAICPSALGSRDSLYVD
jgi:hypothetical protein